MKEQYWKHINGIAIDEIPEEHKKQIETLRQYGLGLEEQSVYGDILEWLKMHDGKMPRAVINKSGKQATREEMTEAEHEEINLYYRWLRSPERVALEACKRNTNRRIARRISRVQGTNRNFKRIWVRFREKNSRYRNNRVVRRT